MQGTYAHDKSVKATCPGTYDVFLFALAGTRFPLKTAPAAAAAAAGMICVAPTPIEEPLFIGTNNCAGAVAMLGP